MRFTYLALENYIGIYNGMGLHKIEIDLSLSKHRMLIIRGENGSGKSTIFNAMNVLPDSNDVFIPGIPASKIIHLLDGPILYKMMFIHPTKSDGSRDTTKAYLTKIFNGQVVEMNPNGNVTSYKDILYDELGLDPNFIALSQLSLDDKGLAGKKPAERKRFVNAIMTSLEVYNNIYKTLTKKSNSIKAIINTVSTKLGTLGDLGVLQSNLEAIENQINMYNTHKDEATQDLMKAKAQKELLDPSGSIQTKHANLASRVAQNKKDLRKLLCKFPFSVFDIRFSINNMMSSINNDKLSLEKIEKEISENKSSIEKNNSSIKDLKIQENQKENMIKSLSSEESYSEVCDKIDDITNDMEDLSDIIKKTGISPGSIDKDEYILALNTLKDIKESITSVKNKYNYDLMSRVMNEYKSGTTKIVNTVEFQKYIDNYLNRAPLLNELIRKCDSDIERLSILDNRPSTCTDDTCPFISDLINIQNSNVFETRSNAVKELNELEVCYDNAKLQLELSIDYNNCVNDFRNLLRLVEINGKILTKLPHGAIYTNTVTFIDALFSNQDFAYIDELYQYIELANCFDEYNNLQKIYNDLISKHDLYLSRSDILDQLDSELSDIRKRIENYNNENEFIINNKLSSLETDKIILERRISDNSKHLENLNTCLKYLEAIESDSLQMNELIDKIAIINNCDSMIDEYAKKIMQYSDLLLPLLKERDKLNHSIQLVHDYQQELAIIKQEYDYIETIKYYSSPTTGIQLVFMQLYMGKIISLANELLNNLFNGQYSIQPFIINETEFRIPCLGDGYINDDISSMSSAQISMISMIISFSLLFNSSTKYNVIKLDEIDGPLDENNRILFTEVLNRIMSIMNTEQCVLISHNSELNVDDSDVILLKSSNLSIEYTRGNIIWKY